MHLCFVQQRSKLAFGTMYGNNEGAFSRSPKSQGHQDKPPLPYRLEIWNKEASMISIPPCKRVWVLGACSLRDLHAGATYTQLHTDTAYRPQLRQVKCAKFANTG